MPKQDQSSQDNPFEAYGVANGDGLRKISDILLKQYKGKILEIYIGDQIETLNFDDYSVPQNCSIYGKLIDVLDRFIILDCYYIDSQTKKLKSGNHLFLNAFQIRAFTEINGIGSLSDVFLHSKDALKIRKLILSGK